MKDWKLHVYYFVVSMSVVFIVTVATGYTKVLLPGLLVSILLSLSLPWGINAIASLYCSLIYGPEYANPSYEHRFYQEDMNKAKGLARDGRLDEAISVYRKVVRNAPQKFEPLLEIAQLYQRTGHPGLAMKACQMIIDLKHELGADHAFVILSEREIEKLREIVSKDKKSNNQDY